MKNSTRNASSSKRIEGVRGVVFYTALKPRYISVHAWEKVGCPPNCYVYDGVHQLLAAGIPVTDAVEVEGRWIRAPQPRECPPTKYRKQEALVKKIVPASKVGLVESEFITSDESKTRKLR